MEMDPDAAQPDPASLCLRAPAPEDGSNVWQLIRDCGPLDENSMYCNLLQCDHFAETCVLAEFGSDAGEVVGWISAYVLPAEPDTLFVWQVAVAEQARGMGLAKRMLDHLLARPVCEGVVKLKTTITKDNEASWALFHSFAAKMDAPVDVDRHFERHTHFEGRHATEYMVTIGAFGALDGAAA